MRRRVIRSRVTPETGVNRATYRPRRGGEKLPLWASISDVSSTLRPWTVDIHRQIQRVAQLTHSGHAHRIRYDSCFTQYDDFWRIRRFGSYRLSWRRDYAGCERNHINMDRYLAVIIDTKRLLDKYTLPNSHHETRAYLPSKPPDLDCGCR